MKRFKALCFILFACAVLFFSCRSAPQVQQVKVDPVDILGDDSLVYFRIPAQNHKEFTEQLISSFAPGLSESNVKMMAERLDTVYAGLMAPKDKSRFQISCSARITPSNVLMLAKSDSWKKEMISAGSSQYPAASSESYGITLSVPASDLLCISQNVEPLLQCCDAAAQGNSEYNAAWLESDAYKFISDDSTENIRFYMVRPVSFITNLLGTTLSSNIFKLNYISGEMVRRDNGKYFVNMDMEFKQPEMVKRAAAFLQLALDLNDTQLAVESEVHIKLSNISVSSKQLKNMLGIKK